MATNSPRTVYAVRGKECNKIHYFELVYHPAWQELVLKEVEINNNDIQIHYGESKSAPTNDTESMGGEL